MATARSHSWLRAAVQQDAKCDQARRGIARVAPNRLRSIRHAKLPTARRINFFTMVPEEVSPGRVPRPRSRTYALALASSVGARRISP
jgi:hypothetical protein